jgi:hypothetical protein
VPDRPRKSDRGGGIHISGGFRIRNLSLSIDQKTGELAGTSTTPEVRNDVFTHWLTVAEESADAADHARVEAAAAPREEDETFNAAVEREFRASMVAVAAAGFAVEAFYWSVREHAPETNVKAESADGRIFETLKRAFKLSGEQQRQLREHLRLLFRARDEAVHPPASWKEPVLHPAFNLGMHPRFVNYRAENAINAHLLARRVIWFCINKPQARYPELVEWCGQWQERVSEPPPRPSGLGCRTRSGCFFATPQRGARPVRRKNVFLLQFR